jgi:hypothetical protein
VRRVACLALLVGGVALSGCGGGDDNQAPQRAATPRSTSTASPTTPEQPPQGTPRSGQQQVPPRAARKADPKATRVIKAWTNALRHGQVDAAARMFALPSIVQNGTPPIAVRTFAQARAFNASLPCGAEFRRAVQIGRFTVVVFRLTERPGGDCAQGVGQAAGTAFVVRHGKIFEWRRVDERTIPPEGVVPSTGRHPPEAPVLPPGAPTTPQVQTGPTVTGPTI